MIPFVIYGARCIRPDNFSWLKRCSPDVKRDGNKDKPSPGRQNYSLHINFLRKQNMPGEFTEED